MTRVRCLVVLGYLFCECFIVGQGGRGQATYTLKPTPKTVAWGYYDAKTPPVLRVKSGDTVEIQTLITSSPKRLEYAVHMMLPKAIFGSAPPR
jgi:hypothetical protein